MTASELRIESGPGIILQVEGELDLGSVGALAEHLDRAAAEPKATICLEMRGVTFIDSTALHAIGVTLGRLQGGCVILHEPSAVVRRVVALVGLDQAPNLHVV